MQAWRSVCKVKEWLRTGGLILSPHATPNEGYTMQKLTALSIPILCIALSGCGDVEIQSKPGPVIIEKEKEKKDVIIEKPEKEKVIIDKH